MTPPPLHAEDGRRSATEFAGTARPSPPPTAARIVRTLRGRNPDSKNIEPARPTGKNAPEQFAGDVWLDVIASPHTDDQRMAVAMVRFAPGARTAWHSHARGQFLHVTEGTALFGSRDGTVLEVHPGQTLYTPPGEDHLPCTDNSPTLRILGA